MLNLAQLTDAHGVTAVARASGLSPSYVWKILRGARLGSRKALTKIKAAFPEFSADRELESRRIAA
jgi:transcriptional regulator with XRE-family HTH domain